MEDDQRMLVYEFMPRGSLENHLFKSMFQFISVKLNKSAGSELKAFALCKTTNAYMISCVIVLFKKFEWQIKCAVLHSKPSYTLSLKWQCFSFTHTTSLILCNTYMLQNDLIWSICLKYKSICNSIERIHCFV